MKYLPNFITLSRMIAALLLLPIKPFSSVFFVLYTYCGISDVLDGFLARRFDLTSETGARLDSIADIVFYAVIALKVFPALLRVLTPFVWCIIAVTAILKIISYAIVAMKYRCFESLHTYMNKITGCLVFAVSYIVFQPFAKTACTVISIVAMLVAMQEVLSIISGYKG